MRVGLFGGGFKPFTTGHFSKLALSLAENDKTYLFYGISRPKKKRKAKGRAIGSREYTVEMADSIYDIVKGALERRYSGNIEVINPQPPGSPVSEIFGFIEAMKNGENHLGIDTNLIGELTVYGRRSDLDRYYYLNDPEKTEKYFGDLISTGRLKFDDAVDEDSEEPLERMMSALATTYEKAGSTDLKDYINVSGTDLRGHVSVRDVENIKRYLPNFLSPEEEDQIVEILLGPEERLDMSEAYLRAFIKATIRG
tara:strand:+ start:290 stop:1051 length:762 start_codon:yes stop_codon:yes gene_type:complete